MNNKVCKNDSCKNRSQIFINSRNGKTPKTSNGNFGKTTIEVPRERESDFELQLNKKCKILVKSEDRTQKSMS